MKSVNNFRYVEKTSAECNEDSYLAILHLSRVELHCKLQEKLHRVTWPLPIRSAQQCKVALCCIIEEIYGTVALKNLLTSNC